MKKGVLFLLGILLIAGGMAGSKTFASLAAAEERNDDGDDRGRGPRNPVILSFDTMVGVDGPYKGATNPIRGINGGGAPWVIAEGRGVLKADGSLRVKVRGLVIPISPFNGTNPSATFRATVSCMTIDELGNATVENVQTAAFPANTLGDANIKEKIDLPSPCIAPIIFVTSAGGAWFSATGH